MTEYHNTDIRLIGQDNLLSVLVGIKSNPLLFPSFVFLPKYSTLLLSNRKTKKKDKKHPAGDWGGRRVGKCIGLIGIKE